MSIFCANVIAGRIQGVFYLANQGYQRQLFPCWEKGGVSGKQILYLVKCLRGVDFQAEGQSKGTRWGGMSCVRRIPLFPYPSAHLALLPTSGKGSLLSPLSPLVVFGLFAFTKDMNLP